ncbi:MAG: TadE/TadG family type IV pilus assembly protein [Planctomycetaceae bacterium]
MHRAILVSCLPCLIALAISFLLLRLVMHGSKARWNPARLRALHRCQDGGVQSLAFVITLPLFIMIVMFIVQVSQLMIGTIVVNYAAFAAARSAAVWIPAEILAESSLIGEAANVLPAPVSETNPILLVFTSTNSDADVAMWEYHSQSSDPRSSKYAYIYTAAAMACLPLAPSRDLGLDNQQQNASVSESLTNFYSAMVPESQANTRIPQRLANKVAYSVRNTAVRIEWVDKNTHSGPTYNPREAVRDGDGNVLFDPSGDAVRSWNSHQVGWQDPIKVTVTHEFALLPGPARYLARLLVRADGEPDRVSSKIDQNVLPAGERVYTTSIWASATMTNEGLQSVIPYVQSTR